MDDRYEQVCYNMYFLFLTAIGKEMLKIKVKLEKHSSKE